MLEISPTGKKISSFFVPRCSLPNNLKKEEVNTVIYSQDIVLNDKTVRSSLFRHELIQHAQTCFFSDKPWISLYRLYVTFCLFLCCFFFQYVSAKFHLWPSSGDLPRPQIGMLSLVTVSPVITPFHSCCLSHHVFDQVNLWPAWVGFETAIFWQCSPGTVETQRLYPLRHGPRRLCFLFNLFFFINPYLVFHSRVRTKFL